ncbi:MAG: phenylalanine--tRNA ligase subunit beta [Deltaproteobacteria bacterium]|nr:phenylalanine--tRNA ligase subunit beta [Deltaproteobacteria bacterium]
MIVSLNWLNEFVEIPCDAREFVYRLTMSGLEAEGIVCLNEMLGSARVGEIKDIKKGNINWVTVDIKDKDIEIATNLSLNIGDKIPVVEAGGEVGKRKVQEKAFGNKVSYGVICSTKNFGMENEELIKLEKEVENGTYLRDIKEFDDCLIDFDITPNRGDCLSMLGIARDASAIFNKPLKKLEYNLEEERFEQKIKVTVENTRDCPRYSARLIKNVNIKESPFLIRFRLLKCGIRPINNIVDITNYVMLALGQPLHAFDVEKLKGSEIIVRSARNGESIITLDGKERMLSEDMLVIADRTKPIAIAGIMGGEETGVTEETRDILIESAHFNPVSVRMTARKLLMHTEASHRFERGVDPENTMEAANYAAYLIQRYAQGHVSQDFVDVKVKDFPERGIICSYNDIREIIGCDIEDEKIRDTIKSLHMSLEDRKERFLVRVPTFRFDLFQCEDIAEEVARIYGYNRIPSILPSTPLLSQKKSRLATVSEKIKDVLSNNGLSEVINYSFVNAEELKKYNLIRDEDELIKISNPLSSEQNVMRPTLLLGLLNNVILNVSRSVLRVPLFEIGRIFIKGERGRLPYEPLTLGIALSGRRYEPCWYERETDFDFYDIKGFFEDVFYLIGADVEYRQTKNPFFHPQKATDVVFEKKIVGHFGEIHPEVIHKTGLKVKNTIVLGEINLSEMVEKTRKVIFFRRLPRYPLVIRDISLLMERSVQVGEILKTIEDTDKHIDKVYIFDLFTKGKEKSVGFRIILRNDEKTFTEDEVQYIIDRVVQRIEEKFAARLRR